MEPSLAYTASLRAVCWLNQSTILAREKIEVIMHCNFLHASFIFQNTHHPNMRHAQPTPSAVGLAASHWDIVKLFYNMYLLTYLVCSRHGQQTTDAQWRLKIKQIWNVGRNRAVKCALVLTKNLSFGCNSQPCSANHYFVSHGISHWVLQRLRSPEILAMFRP